ncbi:SH3 domain-containing protein [Salicibibacter cibi]|uniref:SH3 domain-containing protein n=1 Tax=Salicibibacter cibi TaxID=2743001 RepID=A0A7T7CDY2_9BACI|nr:SH3 domain-containing protein [Salicibibacter cibi]QQK78499.1 SH3 domain-containing protein [Salicibibacter cibi]
MKLFRSLMSVSIILFLFIALQDVDLNNETLAEASTLEEVEHDYGVIQGSDALDVREGPGNDYDVVGQLDNDTRVELEGQTSDGWYKINADDISVDAYVSEEGLEPVDAPEEDEGYVDTDTIVREGPGSSNDQVESIPQGESIDLLGEVEGWYKIQLEDADGSTYISGDHVTFTEPPEAAELTETERTHGVVQGSDALDVREGPGTDYEVVGQLDNDTRVELEGQTSDGWYKINADDISEDAYVSEEGLEPVDAPDEDEGYVDADTSVNVREGPGSSYAQVESIPQGESIDLLGEVEGWYKIQLEDADGSTYISGDHVTFTEPPEAAELTETERTHGVVQGSDALDVREGPGTDYEVVGQLDDDTRVELEGQTSDGWYKINADDISEDAYVSEEGLEPVDAPDEDEGYVDADTSVNVREGPGSSYAQVDAIPRGESVDIVGEIDDWYLIQWADMDDPAYVSASHITSTDIQEEARAETQAETQDQALTEPDHSHGIVQSSHLNVRSGPGTDYDKIAGLDDYTRVELEGETSDGWYKISGEGLSDEAYVSEDFIVPVDVPSYDEGYVDSDLLNVREGPTTDEARVHQLERNEQVAIVGEIGDWYKLQLDDVEGPTYVNADYISEEETLTSPERSYGIVQSSHLNVRSGPGTDYDKIAGLDDYTRVELEGETSDGWYKISGEGLSGEAYVSGDFIVPVDLPEEDIGYVDANVSLNVREGPSTSYDQVSSIPRGERIDLVGEIDGWYKIQMDDVSGPTYVSGSLIEFYETSGNEHIAYTSYDVTFDEALSIQMNGSPQISSASGGFQDASEADVAEYLDPSNNDQFQHLLLTESVGVSANELNNVLSGSLDGMGQAFIDAGDEHSVNEVYLISHALLETGNGTSNLATGIEVGENSNGNAQVVTSGNRSNLSNIRTTYNTFGIGAADHDAETLGAIYAYNEGWFSPEEAIVGGAAFISQRYIHNDYNQNTLYKMRWNPANPGYPQYATDIGWAVKQVPRIESLYQQLDNPDLYFDIPEYQ